VKIAEKLGVREIISFAKRAGFRRDMPADLSLSLGSLTVSPMELVMSYAMFANGGMRVKPVAVKRVLSSDGKLLEENHPETEKILSSGVAFLVTNILEEVITGGTGKLARGLKVRSAGKTGTTDEFRDAWFIGYTPTLLAGVWIGYDDAESLGQGMSGGRIAAPLWLNFMRAVVRGGRENFSKPADIVDVSVDRDTGLRVRDLSRNSYREYFRKGTEPDWKTVRGVKQFFKGLYKTGEKR
jgi:penicillin-binding protein 1A